MNPLIISNMRDQKRCHLVKRVSFGLSIQILELLVLPFGECLEIQLKMPTSRMALTLMVIKEIFKNSIKDK